MPPAFVEVSVQKVNGHAARAQPDLLAIEEPLEIRLGFEDSGKRTHRTVSITMRTPGNDEELAAGLLWSEGIVSAPEQIERIHSCGPATVRGLRNVVRLDLRAGVRPDLTRLDRHSYTTSTCGMCGKTSLDAVQMPRRARLPEGPTVDAELIHQLPDALRRAQAVFERTGGLHGAGLFNARGELLCLREDVGRHNAVDKLIGAQVLADNLPLWDCILLLSGRASFELVQKSAMAGIAVVAAVGSPSSLAVELAHACGMTILGFVRQGRFNIYSGPERIREAGESLAGRASDGILNSLACASG